MKAEDQKVILRMDDVGAATKQNNQRGRIWWPVAGREWPVAWFANCGFIKRMPMFRLWGPYPEMTVAQWEQVFEILRAYKSRMTVGVTAAWVLSENELVPFYKKFPYQTACLRSGLQEGLIEIANHGLTHCVLGNNVFRPKLCRSNRKYHREFWGWLVDKVHYDHLARAQEILTTTFRTDIVTFIPPGNMWTSVTEAAAAGLGLRYLSSVEKTAPTGKRSNGMLYIGNDYIYDFHDREIVLNGTSWLEDLLKRSRQPLITVQEFAEKEDWHE